MRTVSKQDCPEESVVRANRVKTTYSLVPRLVSAVILLESCTVDVRKKSRVLKAGHVLKIYYLLIILDILL